MNGSATIHQVKYILWIQSEHQSMGSPVFRGKLETTAGQTFEFSTLAELNSLLCEMGGWIDTPPGQMKLWNEAPQNLLSTGSPNGNTNSPK
jgi:hypothetical protein